MTIRRASWLVLTVSLLAVIGGMVYAAVTTIPNSALVASTVY